MIKLVTVAIKLGFLCRLKAVQRRQEGSKGRAAGNSRRRRSRRRSRRRKKRRKRGVWKVKIRKVKYETEKNGMVQGERIEQGIRKECKRRRRRK